eukprot:2547476-Pleurochrysis_carterae.AAC.5
MQAEAHARTCKQKHMHTPACSRSSLTLTHARTHAGTRTRTRTRTRTPFSDHTSHSSVDFAFEVVRAHRELPLSLRWIQIDSSRSHGFERARRGRTRALRALARGAGSADGAAGGVWAGGWVGGSEGRLVAGWLADALLTCGPVCTTARADTGSAGVAADVGGCDRTIRLRRTSSSATSNV